MSSENPAISWRHGIARLRFAALGTTMAAVTSLAGPVAPPPSGKLYQGFYYGGVGTDTHDPTEHDVLPQDVDQYEKTVGSKTTCIYVSDNWFESREFPAATCSWIRDLGKIPYLRLMLRSDVEQLHVEKVFTLDKIVAGDFDQDLRAWARAAKDFGGPILIEWRTESNRKSLIWNGRLNSGRKIVTRKYMTVYLNTV